MKYSKPAIMQDTPERLRSMRNHCIGLGAEAALQLASMSDEEMGLVVDHITQILIKKPGNGEYFLPTPKCRDILSDHISYVHGQGWVGKESVFRKAMKEMGEWASQIFLEVWVDLDVIEPFVEGNDVTFKINVAKLRGEATQTGA